MLMLDPSDVNGLREKLEKAGFKTAEEVRKISVNDLVSVRNNIHCSEPQDTLKNIL